jgi:hypothetical protein
MGGGALAHLIGFHQHNVDLGLITLRFEEDDAGVVVSADLAV